MCAYELDIIVRRTFILCKSNERVTCLILKKEERKKIYIYNSVENNRWKNTFLREFFSRPCTLLLIIIRFRLLIVYIYIFFYLFITYIPKMAFNAHINHVSRE